MTVESTKTDQPQRTRRTFLHEGRKVFFVFFLMASFGVLCGENVFVLLAQQRPDRTKAPELGPAPQLTLPPIQKRALSNGLPVWIVETHEVPLVQITLVVLAGSGDDPAGTFGVGSLTAAMLDEGAGSRSALEIADVVEFLGATLTTTSSFDSSAVRLNVPVARLSEALPVMADVALRPAFPQAELDRLRQERLTALLQARDDPASIAAMAFARIVFGNTHRYGTGAAGTAATLKAFTTADLRAFHSALYQPTNATLVVAGDTTAAAILPQLEQQFGGWKATAPVKRAEVPAAAQLTRGQITIVDKPDAEQSQIRIGWVGVPRATPDYFPLVVLNTTLGGSFTSRLNQNLRETHGYSYGASSAFDMRLSSGPFVAAAGVQTDKTADALREFFNELNGIAASRSAPRSWRSRRTTSRSASRRSSRPPPICRVRSRSSSSTRCPRPTSSAMSPACRRSRRTRCRRPPRATCSRRGSRSWSWATGARSSRASARSAWAPCAS
ncbi:MAG: insulinase family protein [Acidimicrobiia bacterium]|nr:insulinase family protein [Acidimicrobiia bacterium]